MADECPKCPPPGAPAWMATFADMMSLLMCFFVLLLSFATMDARKFKRMSESMANAFGVQKQIEALDVPMGTSIIAQHFSPAPPKPTPLEEVKQTVKQKTTSIATESVNLDKAKKELREEKRKQIKDQVDKITRKLKREIEAGLVDVESDEHNIIIRINEKGSFPSGSAVLKAGFEPVLNKIILSINETEGKIRVAGHTDNVPISTDWYRSNWELATTRAVTVSEYMLNSKTPIDANRLVVEGYADTKPLVPNDTSANRAKNRRVEIVLVQKTLLDEENPDKLLNLDKPGEIVREGSNDPLNADQETDISTDQSAPKTTEPPENEQSTSQVDRLLGNRP